MTLVDALLPEFDREMGLTRRVLERVPDSQFAWKPHPTSVTLGRLAQHLADMPTWAMMAMTQRSLDMGAGRPASDIPPATREAVLAIFDAARANGRQALVGKSDGELLAPWTLLSGGQEVFTMPKAGVLRNFVFNHMVHHRGQMTVYLRMRGVAIPSIYGPSGDEHM